MAGTTIGWYVHHQGRGHVHRARAVTAALSRRGVDVTILSSLPAEGWAPWVELPRDDEGGFREPDARGLLHFAPTDNLGHRARLAAIADWVARERPAAAVVDVSVEVTLWFRTQGVRTVVFAMPGTRTDRPHQLGYEMADLVVAPWPGELYRPDALTPHADRVAYVGGISRFEARSSPLAGTPVDVLCLGGVGGSAVDDAAIEAARRATPGRTWRVIGPSSWVDDPWPLLRSARVVVTAAGQGSIADLATAATEGRRAAVVIPQSRPHAEQEATAATLRRHELAVVSECWPAPADWPRLLERAEALPGRWDEWRTAGAADRAAALVARLAEGQ